MSLYKLELLLTDESLMIRNARHLFNIAIESGIIGESDFKATRLFYNAYEAKFTY